MAILTKKGNLKRRAATVIVVAMLVAGCDYFIGAEARYERAQELVSTGEYRRALIELKNALEKQPDMQRARLLLADVALWLGDPISADSELQKVPPEQDPVAHADLEIRIHLALGRFQAVIDRLAGGGVLIADATRSYYRGAAQLGLGQLADAEQSLRSAIDQDPSLVEAKVALTDVRVARNDVAGALELSADIVRDHPHSALAWQARGGLLARRSDNRGALEAFRQARELAPKQLEFVRQAALLAALADVQLALAEMDEARMTSGELARLAPGSAVALITSSRIAMARNDFTAAAADLRRVVNANPNVTQARFLLAVALFAQGNLEQAALELGTVVKQSPENVEARQLLAQVRLRQEDPDGALRALVPALQSGVQDPRLSSLVHAVRAKTEGGMGTELLERALQNAPDNEGLKLQLASAYLQTGESKKALALLRDTSSANAGVQRHALLLQSIADAEGEAAARAEVDAIVAAHPADSKLMGLAAAFYSHIGDAASGRRVLTEALKRNPKDASLLFTLSQLEVSTRRPDAARDALYRLLQVEPEHATARLTLAQIDMAAGDMEAATRALETLRQGDPSAALPRLLLARIALLRDDAARADELIEEAVRAAPRRADLHNAAGVLYLDNGRFDRALAHFRTGTELNPESEVLWLNRGRAQQALGQEGAARESFNRALRVRPDWIAGEGALVFLDLKGGDRTAALDRITRLRKNFPSDASVLVLAGDVYASMRDYVRAAEAYDAAAKSQPSSLLAIKSYDVRRAGGLPAPTVPLENWIEKNPLDFVARSVLANAYTISGVREKAIAQYERIVAVQPEHVASLNNLAWLYFEARDSRAEPLARKAYALAPAAAAVADTLGWILVETGKLEEGLPILRRAAIAGSNPDIRYHHAVALARSGAHAEARAELAKILEGNMTFASKDAAQQLYERLRSADASGS